MTTKAALFVLSSIVAAAALTACTSRSSSSIQEVRFAREVLTTSRSVNAGERVPTKMFTKADVIVYYSYVTWDDVTRSSGRHQVTWNWYRGSELVSSGTQVLEFNVAPDGLWTRRAAAALGSGVFHVEVVVDGKKMSEVQFEIQ